MPRSLRKQVATLLAGALAITFAVGLLAQPAHAEAETSNNWVIQCSYDGGGGQRYWSPSFSVRTPGFHPPHSEVRSAWDAWLTSAKGLKVGEYDARCEVAHEGNLPAIQRNMTPRADLTYERVTWMPDFGVPYQLPREIYYFCTESQQGLQRRFVTDLFKAPTPENLTDYLEKAYRQHERWLYVQGLKPYSNNANCSVAAPEPYQYYARLLDAYSVVDDADRPFHLTRSAWAGVDPLAAPNLIDDLAARAKYAKLSIAPPRAQAKAAPPPPPKAGPPKPAPTGHLEIKTDTSAKDAAKAWDDQVRTALAAEAQKKVETAAKAAQADAELKRKIDAFMAERRRQGNKQ